MWSGEVWYYHQLVMNTRDVTLHPVVKGWQMKNVWPHCALPTDDKYSRTALDHKPGAFYRQQSNVFCTSGPCAAVQEAGMNNLVKFRHFLFSILNTSWCSYPQNPSIGASAALCYSVVLNERAHKCLLAEVVTQIGAGRHNIRSTLTFLQHAWGVQLSPSRAKTWSGGLA